MAVRAEKSVLNNILFSGVEDETFLKEIERKLEKKTVKASETLFKQGDDVKGLYLVLSGQVQVYTNRDGECYILSHAESNHLVGEFLPEGGSVRSVSAQVTEDTTLYFLSCAEFRELGKQFPEQSQLLALKIINRLFWNRTILALHLSHLFEGLSEKIVRRLISEMEIISIPSNTLLIKQEDISDELYIIIAGQFQVYRSSAGSNFEDLRIAGRGEPIGEIGVICQSSRLANALSIRDSTVAKLSRASYEKVLKIYPIEISQTFVTSSVNYILETNKSPLKPADTFVFADLSQTKKPEVIQQLTVALSEFGQTIFLTSDRVDAAFSHKGIAQSAFNSEYNHSLLHWLAEQEITHRYVVYVTDDSMSHWTLRCLRQADHVLFFAHREARPEKSDLEKNILNELGQKRVKKTLLLNHPCSNSVPEQSSSWLKGRTLNAHYHIRDENRADYSRVARFLTGNSIGIVLGGGGAKGFAHIGVIRALNELNIPVDLIGGNSIGAVIAAQYAMQWTHVEMIERTLRLCLHGDRFTLPIRSLFSGKRMTKALLDMFGDREIEDLWLRFFSVSCNISRATVMTHSSGSLLAAVLNSNVPPGLFPPQVVGGDLLVDGALLNNVPVDVMAEMNDGGTIIAVDVNAREDLMNNDDHRGGVSGWQLLLNKINPMAEDNSSPGMIEILTRASMIGGLAQRKKGMNGVADLYLQPPVNEFSLMAYKDAKKIEEAGYRYAMKELHKWLGNKKSLG